MDEITAEFTTQKVQDEATKLEVPEPVSKSWVPIIVGLITLIGMAVMSYILWSRGARVP